MDEQKREKVREKERRVFVNGVGELFTVCVSGLFNLHRLLTPLKPSKTHFNKYQLLTCSLTEFFDIKKIVLYSWWFEELRRANFKPQVIVWFIVNLLIT